MDRINPCENCLHQVDRAAVGMILHSDDAHEKSSGFSLCYNQRSFSHLLTRTNAKTAPRACRIIIARDERTTDCRAFRRVHHETYRGYNRWSCRQGSGPIKRAAAL